MRYVGAGSITEAARTYGITKSEAAAIVQTCPHSGVEGQESWFTSTFDYREWIERQKRK